MKRSRKGLALVVVLFAILLAMAFSAQRSAVPVTIRFLGYTNGAAGALEGVFRIKNTGATSLVVGILPAEFWDGPGASLPGTGKGRWATTGFHSYWNQATVAAGSNQTFTCLAPPNGKVWRLPVGCWNPRAPGPRLGLWCKQKHLLKTDWYFARTVVSDPITPNPPNGAH